MKRILTILLAASVAASLTALAAGGSTLQKAQDLATAYRDTQADEWAKAELSQANQAGLIPEAMADQDLTKPITRQEYAAAAVALLDRVRTLNPDAPAVSPAEESQAPFTDTRDEAVARAYRQGLIQGVGGGRFDPAGLLTREQAATILQRIVKQSGVKLPGLCGTTFVNMTDIDTLSPWAREGASLMANLGVIQGKPDGQFATKFDPRGTLTAQEALVMNQRLSSQLAAFAQDEAQRYVTFAADLFAATKSDAPNKSLSPVSVQYALGLLQSGAQGTTLDQLDRLLYGVDFERWNQVLTTQEDAPVVETANSIWFDTEVTPNTAYIETVKKTFGAESQKADLSAQSAVQTINAWVSDKTHGLIGSILDRPLSDDAAAVLLNALYFKGEWSEPFQAEDTFDQTFHGQNGKDAPVPFLHDTRRGLQYIDTDTCVGAALPYRGGNGWWMLVLMPKGSAPAENLAAENFDGLLSEAQSAYVRLSLPKFTVEGSYDLTQPLQDLGLTAAFVGGDFSAMGESPKGPIALSKVIQKTYLRVDEKGTEAAAVTGAIMEATGAIQPETPIELTFDRPFLCCLWNTELSQPLFLTAVNELG